MYSGVLLHHKVTMLLVPNLFQEVEGDYLLRHDVQTNVTHNNGITSAYMILAQLLSNNVDYCESRPICIFDKSAS